jgi:hypothetical protein
VVAWSAFQLVQAEARSDVHHVSLAISRLSWWWNPIHVSLARTSGSYFLKLKAVDDIVAHLPQLLGMQGKRHYIVLLQNNMELRPTGGFMGSYADIWFEQGIMSSFQIQDIYVPDGQIKGYVKEPEAIRQYLFNDNHPGWRLRDANWNPDFPETVKTLSWFFQEGNVLPADGFIAINLIPLVDVLQVTGPLHLVDYPDVLLTHDTFYQEAQTHAETDFFPGSTQKRDFLGGAARAVITYFSTHINQSVRLVPIIWNHLENKNISIVMSDLSAPSWSLLGWDGRLRSIARSDFLMINEANVGSNKTNCCIERMVLDKVTMASDSAWHELQLTYVNNNPAVPQPPSNWGGGYKDFLRIIASSSAVLDQITIDGTPYDMNQVITERIRSKTVFGFLVTTGGTQQSQVTVNYHVSWNQPTYRLFVQKQSGMESLPFTLFVNNKGRTTSTAKRLQRDWLFTE